MLRELLVPIVLALPAPADDPEPGDRAERLRHFVSHTVSACEKIAPRAKLAVDACSVIGTNKAYWESALRYDVHSGARLGPAGEECPFQIHRHSAQVPFPEWRPHPYGTNRGLENTHRCAESGVKILAYHAKRCGIRGVDAYEIAILYSEYHRPGDCKTLRPLALRQAHMATRTLRKLRQAHKRETAPRERGAAANLDITPDSQADHATACGTRSNERPSQCAVSVL